MILFIVLGALAVASALLLILSIKVDDSSGWVLLLLFSTVASFLAFAMTLAEAWKAAGEFRDAESRGRELSALVRVLDDLQDPLMKAKVTVEIYAWNQKLEDAKRGNASEWRDLLWSDEWATLKPISLAPANEKR